MTNAAHAKFWDKIADRYAARPLKDPAAYEAMLGDAAGWLRHSDRVLEIGCGTGSTAIRLAPHVAQWRATDFSPEMLRIARGKQAPDNVQFVQADAQHAFDDGPYDAICAFQVLHLVDDLAGTLAQIHDHLRPGGVLISKTWCFAEMSFKLRALFFALRTLGLFPNANSLSKGELRQAIRAAGFEIEAERVFGENPHGPYIIARRTAA